ncbi:hypothetical protein NIM72_05310 [Pantoea sp. B550]|uniref:hypothetical protein n=1 Tax=Pantoea TaxID=53335 RepID=UPI000E7FFE99|nr:MULTISPECIES: hypothetical protein [Pantoea]MCP1204970.1 hypothetical protein [Pantoea sp. B550]NBB57433.1 hypothetical protein [Pantoea vagans]HBV89498.1 hypothetical protein [Pantoea sp.]MCT2418261.1 hypothetical protein [Pantoea sp. XY16]QZX97421.1 hypothetical protein K6R05_07020 [Pantoea alfalfae]
MLIQIDEKGHVIIGEAALSLALGEKEISIASLFTQLGFMAKSESNPDRLTQISEARRWLSSFKSPSVAQQQVPYLQTLAALNEELKQH